MYKEIPHLTSLVVLNNFNRQNKEIQMTLGLELNDGILWFIRVEIEKVLGKLHQNTDK